MIAFADVIHAALAALVTMATGAAVGALVGTVVGLTARRVAGRA